MYPHMLHNVALYLDNPFHCCCFYLLIRWRDFGHQRKAFARELPQGGHLGLQGDQTRQSRVAHRPKTQKEDLSPSAVMCSDGAALSTVNLCVCVFHPAVTSWLWNDVPSSDMSFVHHLPGLFTSPWQWRPVLSVTAMQVAGDLGFQAAMTTRLAYA